MIIARQALDGLQRKHSQQKHCNLCLKKKIAERKIINAGQEGAHESELQSGKKKINVCFGVLENMKK